MDKATSTDIFHINYYIFAVIQLQPLLLVSLHEFLHAVF